jgi:hypothetical protein
MLQIPGTCGLGVKNDHQFLRGFDDFDKQTASGAKITQ